jgi:hypothetical protein
VGETTTVPGESRDGDVAEVKRYFAAGIGQAWHFYPQAAGEEKGSPGALP